MILGRTLLLRCESALRAVLILSAAAAPSVGTAGCADDGTSAIASDAASTKSAVSISGNQLLRDGVAWTPHCVQITAFVAPLSAQMAPFTEAYAHYSTKELDDIKTWGADCIRFQLSQPSADPNNTEGLHDAAFIQTFISAVKYTRSIGLVVIVSIQDEMQSGESSPASLPNDTTRAIWTSLTGQLNGDDGIVYEMFNEPSLAANTAGWTAWQGEIDKTVQTIRSSGATNALLADGLNTGGTLDGLIPLTDPLNKMFYSVHPYFNRASDQLPAAWATRFGNAAAQYPAIVGEWTTAKTYYYDACTATYTTCSSAAALQMLQYMQANHIGLVAVSYDFGLPLYGGIVSDYAGTPTTFANGIQPMEAGWGPGTIIQNWYKTGSVPTQLQYGRPS